MPAIDGMFGQSPWSCSSARARSGGQLIDLYSSFRAPGLKIDVLGQPILHVHRLDADQPRPLNDTAVVISSSNPSRTKVGHRPRWNVPPKRLCLSAAHFL